MKGVSFLLYLCAVGCAAAAAAWAAHSAVRSRGPARVMRAKAVAVPLYLTGAVAAAAAALVLLRPAGLEELFATVHQARTLLIAAGAGTFLICGALHFAPWWMRLPVALVPITGVALITAAALWWGLPAAADESVVEIAVHDAAGIQAGSSHPVLLRPRLPLPADQLPTARSPVDELPPQPAPAGFCPDVRVQFDIAPPRSPAPHVDLSALRLREGRLAIAFTYTRVSGLLDWLPHRTLVRLGTAGAPPAASSVAPAAAPPAASSVAPPAAPAAAPTNPSNIVPTNRPFALPVGVLSRLLDWTWRAMLRVGLVERTACSALIPAPPQFVPLGVHRLVIE